jgi:hypothetical protein
MLLSSFGTVADSKRSDDLIIRDNSGSYIQHVSDFDSSGNIISYYSYSKVFSKTTKDGAIVWQRQLQGFGIEFIFSLRVLSDGTIFISGFIDKLFDTAVLIKFNSGGNWVWSREYVVGRELTRGAYFDSDLSGNNAYLVFTRKYNTADPNTAPFLGNILKINTTDGQVIWSKELAGNTGLRTYIDKVKVGINGDAYIAGYDMISSDFDFDSFVAKINTSGSMVWQRKLARNNVGQYSRYIRTDGLRIDSADNIYFSGSYRYDASPKFGEFPYYAKFSSSGVLQHHYAILSDPVSSQNFPSFTPGADIAGIGSTSYVFGRGYMNTDISTRTYGYIFKINDGTLEYARQVYLVAPTFTYGSIEGPLADPEHIFFSSYVFSGGPRNGFFKLPASGAKVGKYEVMESIAHYEEFNAQLSAPPVTVSSNSLNFGNISETLSVNNTPLEAIPSNEPLVTFNRYVRRI